MTGSVVATHASTWLSEADHGLASVATREKRKLTVGRAARATNGAPVVGPPRASGYRVGRVIGPILLDILLPILAMIALGAWLRWKFHVDLSTLTKLNIYLFVPAFVFQQVATSTLPWADMGGVVAVTVLQVIALGAIVWAVGDRKSTRLNSSHLVISCA